MERMFKLFGWCMTKKAIYSFIESWDVARKKDKTLEVTINIRTYGDAFHKPLVFTIENHQYMSVMDNILIPEDVIIELDNKLNKFITLYAKP